MKLAERQSAMVEELRRASPAGRTASWLAHRFEVSTRTVKRDVATLIDAGAPIEAEPGRGGGYRLARSARLPPLVFTAGEAAAVAIAMATEPELPFLLEARGALARLLGVMSPAQRREVAELCSRIWIRADRGRGPAAAVLDEAIRENRVVHLDYVDGNGVSTRDRPVEPMAFARTREHWHLLAWCRLREAGRWFRTDRVSAARLTPERAPARDLTTTFGEPPLDARPVTLDLEGA